MNKIQTLYKKSSGTKYTVIMNIDYDDEIVSYFLTTQYAIFYATHSCGNLRTPFQSENNVICLFINLEFSQR